MDNDELKKQMMALVDSVMKKKQGPGGHGRSDPDSLKIQG